MGGQLRGSWLGVSHRAAPFTPALPRSQTQRKSTPLPYAALKVHCHLSWAHLFPQELHSSRASDSFHPFSLPFWSHPRALLGSAYPSHPFPLLRLSAQPHSQRHRPLFFFLSLAPQLLLPGRVWAWEILSMGTARVRHLPLWGQRREYKGLAQRGQQEAKERRHRSGASGSPQEGAD